MNNAYIIAARRTPVGTFQGAFSTLAAPRLGAIAISAALKDAKVPAADIEECFMGQVLTAGAGQAPARQAALYGGLPHSVPCLTINKVCGSGLKAVMLAADNIALGHTQLSVAGGQENMTLAPHLLEGSRAGFRMGHVSATDSMIKDGLWDAFHGYHMGITAENVAQQWQITRQMQDEFAVTSQHKAEAAQKSGKFKAEIVPITIKQKKADVVFYTYEYIRAGATIEAMQALKPAFSKDGSVTAANASGLNDGAAAVVLMTAANAQKRGLKPLARIASWATVGVEPAVMGSGPIPASRAALQKAGWKVSDLDLIEANEAFAAQACAVNKDMGWDLARVNVHGGAIALGHPIGASGCRVLVTLLHAMADRNAKRGLTTLCIGGGMGIAMCVEAA